MNKKSQIENVKRTRITRIQYRKMNVCPPDIFEFRLGAFRELPMYSVACRDASVSLSTSSLRSTTSTPCLQLEYQYFWTGRFPDTSSVVIIFSANAKRQQRSSVSLFVLMYGDNACYWSEFLQNTMHLMIISWRGTWGRVGTIFVFFYEYEPSQHRNV